MNAGRLVAKPIRARVPGTWYGRRFSTASGPVLGPLATSRVSSMSVSGTFLFCATTLRRIAGPSVRTLRGPHMKTSL